MHSEETLSGKKKKNHLRNVWSFYKEFKNFSFSAGTGIVTFLIIPKLNYCVSPVGKQHDIYYTFLNPGMFFNCFINIVKVQHTQKKFKKFKF